MSKRWLGCIVLAIVTWSSAAFASLTSTVNPIALGDVEVGSSGSAVSQAESTASDLLDHFHLSAGCAGVAVAPTTATLPTTILAGTPMDFDVTFTPAARGSVSCSVEFHTVAHVSIGTAFTVTARGIAPVLTAPASATFPARRVANAALLTASQDVVLGNTGEVPLDITALATTGDFTVASPATLPQTIAPGGSLTVSVVFDPTAPGTRTGDLTITSTDPANPSDIVTLSGQGTSAIIAVTDEAFGVVALGSFNTQTIAVTNTVTTNAGPLRLASASIAGGAGWFTFEANGFSCAGLTACTFGAGIVAPQNIGVRCTPPANASGSMTATVTFVSDTDPGGDAVAGLSCTAGRADASPDPTSLDYGTAVDVGSSVARTVTVTNPGNLPLTYTATKSGARANEYVFSGCVNSCVVAAGGNRQFTLTFSPTSTGAANITVNVASNDPDDPNIAIPVTATAVAPSITAPNNFNFGNVEVATTSSTTLTITNNGTADLLISSATLTINDGSYAITAGTTGAQTVAPSGSASWDLTCTPATQGAHAGRFTIVSNALGSPTRHITLACNGTEGVLAVSPSSIDFGPVPENSGPVIRAYTLTNPGNLPVNTIAANLAPNNVGYSLDPATPIPTTLAAGASVNLNVRFSPLSAADGGPATVAFTGTWGTGAKPLRSPPTLALNGDGRSAGFSVDPQAIAFGDVRFDATASRTFCITNTSETTLAINTITITPAVGTTTGEFTAPVAQIRRRTCGTAGGTSVTLPASLTTNEQLEVTVIVNPANRTGAMAATLTVTSNLAANPTRDVALTANSTSGVLTLAPGSTVDFGVRDVQGPSTSTDIVITNAGDGPLDLSGFTRSDNGTNTHFVLTLPGTTTLQPNESLTIPVTYAPAAATLPAESIVLSHQVTGAIAGPASQTITLTGRGIDRSIELVAATDFPATFRNPGSQAPVRPVTVRNVGEAPLAISAAMLSNTDPAVWTLVDANPVVIPGGASVDFLVRFAPTTIGPSTATLVITSDDDANPMATVELSGTAIDRNVAFGAPTISLGFTGVGVPVTIDEALLVANMNATTSFKIARVEIGEPGPTECTDAGAIADPAAFAIADAPVDVFLPAQGTQLFGVTFAPEVDGKFVATANLIIDEDPVPQAKVCLVGTAVFVDARGGGGCQTGGDVGGGVLLLVAVALVVRRRRASLALVGLLAVVPAARADKVLLSIFDPTPSTTGANFQLQSADVGQDGAYVLTASFSHATNPLVLDAFLEGQFFNDHAVVERSTMLVLGGAYAFLDRYEVGARMPFYTQAGQAFGDPQQMFTATPAEGTATGDFSMHGKVRFWRNKEFSFAGAGQLTLPTSSEGEFTGTTKPSLRVLALASLVPDAMQRRLSLSANLGGVLRSKSRFANIEQGGGATWGLGMAVRAHTRVHFAAEMFGDVLPSARMESAAGNKASLSPIEWLVGVRWTPDERVTLGLAGGRGLTSAIGSPDVRAVLSFTWAPGAEIAGATSTYSSTLDEDSDRDGIRDVEDRCPSEPEDADLFDDKDGCPDLDNDQDGVADDADRCPLDAEDKDGFQDADGCPDKDNDNDLVADRDDKCPNEPEDKDGFADLDGCPDLDNDKDGIPDAKDKCPAEAETINGNKDEDGCADPGDSAVVLGTDRIDTLDAITFAGTTAKLSRASFNILGQVGATMRAHPEILRLRVTSYVQPTGNWDKDQELSEKRAQVIRDWLVEWGVAANRVEARGFGGSKPLVAPDKKGAAALNDRIELVILERN